MKKAILANDWLDNDESGHFRLNCLEAIRAYVVETLQSDPPRNDMVGVIFLRENEGPGQIDILWFLPDISSGDDIIQATCAAWLYSRDGTFDWVHPNEPGLDGSLLDEAVEKGKLVAAFRAVGFWSKDATIQFLADKEKLAAKTSGLGVLVNVIFSNLAVTTFILDPESYYAYCGVSSVSFPSVDFLVADFLLDKENLRQRNESPSGADNTQAIERLARLLLIASADEDDLLPWEKVLNH